MIKKNILIICFLIIFFVWIVFIPDPLQQKYKLHFELFLILFLALSVQRHKFNASKYFFAKTDLILWFYILSISMNIWFAEDKKLALAFYNYSAAAIIAVYFFIKNEVRQTIVKKAMYILVFLGLCISIYGFVEIFTKSNILYEHFISNYFYKRFIGKRMMSTLVHPNILGAYLLVCIPLAGYFYSKTVVPKLKAIYFFSFLTIIAALILTYSRGAWIAAILMCTVYFLFKRKFRYIFILWALAFAFCYAITLFEVKDEVLRRFGFDYFWNYFVYGHRTIQYFVTINMLKQHPFVGIGLNHYRMLFNQYANRRLSYEVMIPDSIYLMHLAETGLLGFIGLMLFLGSIIKKGIAYYKSLLGDDKDIFLAIFLGFLGLIFDMASFDGFLWLTPFYLFWFFAAVIVGAIQQDHNFR